MFVYVQQATVCHTAAITPDKPALTRPPAEGHTHNYLFSGPLTWWHNVEDSGGDGIMSAEPHACVQCVGEVGAGTSQAWVITWQVSLPTNDVT